MSGHQWAAGWLETCPGARYSGVRHRALSTLRTLQRRLTPPAQSSRLRSVRRQGRGNCNCSADHPGRPKDAAQGCGAWWQITMVRQSDGTWRVEPGDPEMAAAATALAKEITAGELKSVRAAAEKWIAGVAAIYGLFSLAAALVAKTTVATLPTPALAAVAGLAIVSLIGALVSILASYSAAYGWPTLTDIEYDTGLLKWFAHQQNRLPKAVRRLHQAVYCAVASLAALAIAFGIVWLFPPASPALVTVTFN